MSVTFSEWTQSRSISCFGTNAGAQELPFQTWRTFKEAYAPELIARAVQESAVPVNECIDPFGGSGTTALACQFLGVHPTTIEVNPFLADLIEAKLAQYDADELARDLGEIARCIYHNGDASLDRFSYLPSTFIEPGVKNRWVFNRNIASRLAAFQSAIETVSNEDHRRLFLVLLGGILIGVSNVVISGKGRRYRRSWRDRQLLPSLVDEAFFRSAQIAIGEIHRYANRIEPSYKLIRGDCRQRMDPGPWDLAVFSPPYPNSFDYTDVYNVELWVLGYLTCADDNRVLRQATLPSHVQTSRSFALPPEGSATLETKISDLENVRPLLWDRRIPDMVGAYFADLMGILEHIRRHLRPGGSIWLVVGDSRYADVHIATAEIIVELVHAAGWRVKGFEAFRSMRSSAQQGGSPDLAESLIIID